MKNLNRRWMLERKSAQVVSKWPIRQENKCLYSTLMLFLFGLIWFGSVIAILYQTIEKCAEEQLSIKFIKRVFSKY